ncbi:methyltransferase [bacterium]|nr:MAG: methyltransferase [bacterium]
MPKGLDVALTKVRAGKLAVSLYRVADPNALADSVDPATFAVDERFPYWSEVWPSSLGLAAYISRMDIPFGLPAIELGCGTGLCGVVAALRGARVTFTDYERDALRFARANHALNTGRPGLTRIFDWRDPPRNLSARLVLASDVIYESRFIEPFLRALKRTTAPGGMALVAEPWRKIARNSVERLEGEGFKRTLHLEEVTIDGRTHAIWIHKLLRTRRRTA